jgi:hypothetical protein
MPAPGLHGDHPDAELLELGRLYLSLSALEKAADKHYDACYAAYNEPPQPDVLRHRMDDHVFGLHLPLIMPPGSRRGLSADPSQNGFYSEEEITRLRYAPPPSDPEMIPVQQALIQEIEQASEKWLNECEAAEDEAGLIAAKASLDAVVDQQRSLAKRIAAMPAVTPTGLQVRALILSEIAGYRDDEEEDEDDPTDHLMIRAIVRDLVKMKI